LTQRERIADAGHAMPEPKTSRPLLVSVGEAAFQLNLSAEEVEVLIGEGDLTAVEVLGRVLVRYESLVKFVRHAAPIRDLSETVARS
jgi:hypothetical protein